MSGFINNLENYVNSADNYSMSVYTDENKNPVAVRAGLNEPVKKTGNKEVDSLSDILKEFQWDMKQYYNSSFYNEFKVASAELGYGNITPINKIEVNKLLRHAAAYMNIKDKVIGVSDKRADNYNDIANQMSIDRLLAVYGVLSHEHIHGKSQSNKVFEKGRLYTELDCEAKMYSALVQMAENNPKKAKEYLKLANGVMKRYDKLDKAYAHKTTKSSGLLEKYVSKVEQNYKKAA